MEIRCKNCGTRYFIKDELLSETGLKVKCKKCGYTFIVRKRITPKPKVVKKRILNLDVPQDRDKIKVSGESFGIISEWKLTGRLTKFLFIFFVLLLSYGVYYGYKSYIKIKVVEEVSYSYRNFQFGYYEDAIDAVKKALKKYPDNVLLNFIAAQIYYIMDDARYKSFFARCAEGVDDEAVKGSLLIRAGMVGKGIEILKEELPLSEGEKRYAIENDMAIGYILSGEVKEGVNILNMLREKMDFFPDFNLSVYYFHSNKLRSAYDILENLYSLRPGDVRVLINMGILYAKKGAYSKAEKLLLTADGKHKYKMLVVHNLYMVYKLMNDERYLSYAASDIIEKKDFVPVGYQFALNPEVALE